MVHEVDDIVGVVCGALIFVHGELFCRELILGDVGRVRVGVAANASSNAIDDAGLGYLAVTMVVFGEQCERWHLRECGSETIAIVCTFEETLCLARNKGYV